METEKVTAIIHAPSKTRLIRVGKHDLAIGGFSVAAATEHLENHQMEVDPEDRWCDLRCFAKTMFHRESDRNVEQARERIGRLHASLRDSRDKWLVIEYLGNNRSISRFKLHGSDDSPGENEALNVQLARLRAEGELHGRKGLKAQAILQLDLGF